MASLTDEELKQSILNTGATLMAIDKYYHLRLIYPEIFTEEAANKIQPYEIPESDEDKLNLFKQLFQREMELINELGRRPNTSFSKDNSEFGKIINESRSAAESAIIGELKDINNRVKELNSLPRVSVEELYKGVYEQEKHFKQIDAGLNELSKGVQNLEDLSKRINDFRNNDLEKLNEQIDRLEQQRREREQQRCSIQ